MTLSCRYADINTANALRERAKRGPAGANFRVAANRIPDTIERKKENKIKNIYIYRKVEGES